MLGYRSVFQIHFPNLAWLLQVKFRSLSHLLSHLPGYFWWVWYDEAVIVFPKLHDFLLCSKNQHQWKNTYLLIATTPSHWDILTNTNQTKPQTKNDTKRDMVIPPQVFECFWYVCWIWVQNSPQLLKVYGMAYLPTKLGSFGSPVAAPRYIDFRLLGPGPCCTFSRIEELLCGFQGRWCHHNLVTTSSSAVQIIRCLQCIRYVRWWFGNSAQKPVDVGSLFQHSQGFLCIPSGAGFLNHQQYEHLDDTAPKFDILKLKITVGKRKTSSKPPC